LQTHGGMLMITYS